MKKMWKKIIALAAAVLMIVGMLPAAVMADTIIPGGSNSIKTGTVTIKKTEPGVEGDTVTYKPVANAIFSFYKIAALIPGETAGTYASWSTANDKYTSALGDLDAYGNYSASQIEAKAADFQKIITDYKIAATTTVTTTDAAEGVTTSALELGYYLVVETTTPAGYIASKPFFVAVPSTNAYGTAWEYDVSVQPKNTTATVKKEIITDDKGTTTSDTVGVNDTVNYKITTTMPSYDDSYNQDTLLFKVSDNMSGGLDLQDSIKVYVDGKEMNAQNDDSSKNYTLQKSEHTFTITFEPTVISANKGKSVVVTYSGKVNEGAIVGINGNTNKAKIEYNNKPDSTAYAESTTLKVYTFDIEILKKGEGTDAQALQGAEFKLYTDNTCTREVTDVTGKDSKGKFITGNEGKVTFGKLDAGTYYLKEVKAPSGYTLLTNPIKIEIIALNGTDGKPDGKCDVKVDGQNKSQSLATGIVLVEVTNHKGFTLPATGGMGTYLFTIGGVVLMAGAVVLLLAMRRKKAN